MAARAAPDGAPQVANGSLASLLALEVEDAGLRPTLPHLLSTNVDNLIANFGVTIDDQGVIKASLLIVMFRIDPAIYPREGNANAAITMTTTAGINPVVSTSANFNGIQDNANGAFLRKLIITIPAATMWLQDLVAAEQIRKLTPKNIEGYFMSKNSTRVIGRDLIEVVDYAARGLPKILSDAGARAIILDNASDWMKYHTSATSTAALVHRAVREINASFPGFFRDETLEAVEDANEDKWDKDLVNAIPLLVIQVVYIFLRASKQLPDGWFQGQKAYDVMNPAVAKKYDNFFKRYFALAGDQAATDAVTDITGLVAYQTATGGFHGI